MIEISFFILIYKQLPILPHHNLAHLLHGIGAIMIEPSGDDGTESVDEERSFIVSGGVIAFGFETSAELLGVGFYTQVKFSAVSRNSVMVASSESISKIAFLISTFIFVPHFIRSSVRRMISGASFLLFAFTIAL